jgi:hypothetical protein
LTSYTRLQRERTRQRLRGARRQGRLAGRHGFTTNAGKTFSGKGTGAFKEAAGPLAGQSVTGDKTAVTIIYSWATAALSRPNGLCAVAAGLRGKERQLSGREASGQEEQATHTTLHPRPLS